MGGQSAEAQQKRNDSCPKAYSTQRVTGNRAQRKRQRPRGLWRLILEDAQLDRISSSGSAFRLRFQLSPFPVSSNSPSVSTSDSHRRSRPPDLPSVQRPACAGCCSSGSAFQPTSNFRLRSRPPAVPSIDFQLASVFNQQRCQRLQPPTSVGYCISGFCLPAILRFASAINSPALPAINFRLSSAANSQLHRPLNLLSSPGLVSSGCAVDQLPTCVGY